MKAFVNITRLDYLNPEDVVFRDELKILKSLYKTYSYKAIEFIIKNNLHRRKAEKNDLSLVAMRVVFKDIWEWHIPDELKQIITRTVKIFAPEGTPRGLDCLWMLKETLQKNIPVYFCDIVFFLPDSSEDGFLKKISKTLTVAGDHVANSRILFAGKKLHFSTDDWQKLFYPGNQSTLLQCEFAHDLMA